MSLSSTTSSRIQYNGNGSTTEFSVPFIFKIAADLDVYITNTTTGIETLKTIDTHYTVTGGGGTGIPATGTLTMLTAPASGEVLTIIRNTSRTQSFDPVQSGQFNVESLEAALDKLTLISQEIDETLERTSSLTPGSTGSSVSFGTLAANQILKMNADADTIVSVSSASLAVSGAITGTTGLVTATDTTGSFAARTITAGAGITVTNGNGVSGNPTIALTSTPLVASNNLSDLSSASTARTNLGLGTAAVQDSGDFLLATNDLSDLADAATARTNLGLGSMALKSVSDGTVGQYLKTDGAGNWSFATVSGGGSGGSLSVNQSTHGFAVGDILKRGSGSYAKAQADSSANSEVVGIVTAVADTDNFTLTVSGSGTLSGASLTDGTCYFLSPSSAGAYTTTETSTATQVSKPVFVATSSTTFIWINQRGIII